MACLPIFLQLFRIYDSDIIWSEKQEHKITFYINVCATIFKLLTPLLSRILLDCYKISASQNQLLYRNMLLFNIKPPCPPFYIKTFIMKNKTRPKQLSWLLFAECLFYRNKFCFLTNNFYGYDHTFWIKTANCKIFKILKCHLYYEEPHLLSNLIQSSLDHMT